VSHEANKLIQAKFSGVSDTRPLQACFQIFGGFGFAREQDVERRWHECRLFQTAPISTNMVLAYLAQTVLGLPRGY